MATITIKNIPDDLYGRLRQQAKVNRRSINAELIRCLEELLQPRRVTVDEQLQRIRDVRPRVDPAAVDPDDILKAIDQGRP